MSHKSLRALIESTVNNVYDAAQYSYGPITDFNQARKKNFLMVNLSPLQASISYAVDNVTNYSKSWNVEMVFYKFDKESSIDSGPILDETDEIVDKFINRLNQVEGPTITAMSQTPFIKVLADILTGHLLTLTITLPDDFDYCQDC